ncbi:alpha/beta fold hydrolase [Bradyrhizobium sp. AUGA SZCCT0222]|uniref:alpha/beta fold hydrolase n=1 Tax=Bradyrhizobium sp. AUGA SZCCT0222 TaxID=2807668 RepID=UPI001BA90981|nr:alpha/beta fold hydrolase [Bradyrhizobium sp. AUGA SZCCT0222]MBR1272299.1 alpha/beta fold hydrolase [Bradyrhizobium sp. AUGA SZCCT0222]
MNILTQVPSRKSATACVVALHCSLGSGRQWAKLGAEFGPGTKLIAPDLIGYGDKAGTFDLPLTLAQEVECLRATLDQADGPIHLVGHSYGGAIAFKIATDPAYEHRIQSLALIEPVLPTLLRDSAPDRRLHDQFEGLAAEVREDIWNGSVLEAIDKFSEFWCGSGPREELPVAARIRMIEHAERLPYDFAAAFAEENVTMAAASLRLPTLLLSGGQSPNLTQRIVRRLAAVIDGAELRHLPDAGHMLAMTHAGIINPVIAAHIARADELAGVSLAAGQPAAKLVSVAGG